MKKAMRIAVACVAFAAFVIGLFALGARSRSFSPSEIELRAKYMLATSKFIEIEGQQIHYSDEGKGPAIVLVHGTLGNLRMWNDWAALLSSSYRVIRFDRPPYGLSGPNPQGRYGIAREVEIISGLVDKLGLEQFYLVATSSAGWSVTQYAAQHPDKIAGVVLSNIAVLPHTVSPTRNPWIVRQSRVVAGYLKGWHPEFEWRGVLKVNMVNHDRITDALVTEYAELNGRLISYEASQTPRPPVPTGQQTTQALGLIAAPALVLWSEDDSERPPQPTAEDAMRFLGSSDKTLVVIPRCEHMMPLDCGPESAAAAKAFFDRLTASVGN
jgi:pimeloyl-ACP methyl ester carboxylesterase